MIESDELYLIRFRYGRASEILIAYKTFLHKQISTGSHNDYNSEESIGQVTHTLLLVFYSFIYSMFDKGGTDFITASEPYIELLSEDGKEYRNEIIKIWEQNKIPILKLRNNIGFHGGAKIKSHVIGYDALAEINPYASEFIMNQMALFFLELDKVIPPTENYNIHIDREEVCKKLLERAKKIKSQLDNNTYSETVRNIKKLMK